MRRALFNLGAALSLLLCIALGVLWARSGPYDERIQGTDARWPREEEGYSYSYYFAAASYAGTVSFRFNREHFTPEYFQGLSAEERKRMREQYQVQGLRWYLVKQDGFGYFLSEGPRPGFWAEHYDFSRGGGHQGDD